MIRKKADFVLMMCRYWSLKREARRGAPLLKRLHLEPWTASAGSRAQSEEEKVMKLEVGHLSRFTLGGEWGFDDIGVLATATLTQRSRECPGIDRVE